MSPVSLFKKDWAALCAGNETDGYNAMTIAWGSIGTLWERGNRTKIIPTCTVYVRPIRFTHHLLEENDLFTVSFMDVSHKRALALLGTKTGRDDPNKITNAGLNLVKDGEAAYMDESELVLICRKIYHQPLELSRILDQGVIERDYKGNPTDLHEMFIGEIIKVLVKDR